MALIKCPECGKEISDKATQCIHCGYPLDSNSNKVICIINNIEYDFTDILDKVLSFYNSNREIGFKIKADIINLTGINDMAASTLSAKITINKTVPKYFNPAEYPDTPSAKNILKCPKCGSTAITTGARGVNWTLGIIGASKTVNRCGKCGYTWKPKG